MNREDNDDRRGDGTPPEGPNGSPYGYNPTPHPEDAPGGFQSTGGHGTGSGGYGGYGGYSDYATGGGDPRGYPSYPGHGYEGYAQNGRGGGIPGAAVPMERASGRVDVMRAVRFGFRAEFGNPAVWILGTIGVGFAFFVIALMVGFGSLAIDPSGQALAGTNSVLGIALNLIVGALTIAVTVFVLRGALVEVDGTRARLRDFFSPVNAWQTVLIMVVLSVTSYLLSAGIDSAFGNFIVVDESSGEVEFNSGPLLMQLVFLLVLVLVNPLYAFWIWYTSDGRHSAASAAGTGFRDAVRNYGPLLAFSVISGIVLVIAAIVTLTLALIVLAPAQILINAHLYRQMSGGMIPVEQPRG
ncbi:hypothetical protein [Corynebacterium pacaense]|uniref:hypothetical protein n=1 Tax=Corynebacterium pacaense TaxID=1816684 RepID=UPI0009BA4E1B|nr:hypothetical protein [Corynebacterium pacaense]